MKRKYFLLFLIVLIIGFTSAATQTQANSTLNSKIDDFQNFQLEIQEQNLFVQQNLNSIFNLSEIQAQLNSAFGDFSSIDPLGANSPIEYDALILKVSLIEIPQAILEIGTAISLPIFPDKNNFDFDLLKKLGWSEYTSSQRTEYENALSSWTINNIEVKVGFDSFSGIIDGSEKHLFTTFDLEISKDASINYSTFVFIEDVGGLNFKEDYGETKNESFYYIRIQESSETISFSTTEDITFEELSFFIAPPPTELSFVGSTVEFFEEGDEEGFKWTLFTLVMFVLFIIGIIVYSSLQAWYKKKYENYLFKNKNDLYNLANYIATAKRKRMDNQQIAEKLRRSKWSGEQVRYALRKYSGRRTGMFEIPLEKVIKKDDNLNK